MKIIKTKLELSNYLNTFRELGLTIGFVPTMGALHQGHLSLLQQCKLKCNVSVVSIFVNPTQFNHPNDLLGYPKPIEQDIELLTQLGCDVLFLPEVAEMYPNDEQWEYHVGDLDYLLEGEFRPGHYRGVTQIVYKLFNLVKPDFAFFGQKDYQQFLVIKKLIADFDLKINLVACAIIREKNGLAMSSRNVRLNAQEKEKAQLIYQSLLFVKENYAHYEIDELLDKAKQFYLNDADIKLEYFSICDQETLEPITAKNISKGIALVACFVGETRLIDNMMLD